MHSNLRLSAKPQSLSLTNKLLEGAITPYDILYVSNFTSHLSSLFKL